MIILEGIAMCFWLLIWCTVGISNGAVGLVSLFEKDVQERVVELGFITEEKMKKNALIYSLALFIPVLAGVPLTVYLINGADSFMSGFLQMTAVFLIGNLFDRLFIDWYWVGHTKAWIIEGTEDLQPYIPVKASVKKWIGTIIVFPMYAALIAWVVELIR